MRKLLDVGNALVLLGLVALVVSSFMPMLSGQRVARVENRALEVAQSMLLTLPDGEQLGTWGESDWAKWIEVLRAECASRGQPASDLPAPMGTSSEVPTLGNRHYLFRILRRPPPATELEPVEPLPSVFEVFAWPRSLSPPGRSVFCLARDQSPVYTRNLIATYNGLDAAPSPGAAVPRPDSENPEVDSSYRSVDGERWIRFVPRAP